MLLFYFFQLFNYLSLIDPSNPIGVSSIFGDSLISFKLFSFNTTPNPDSSGTIRYPFSSFKGLTNSLFFCYSDSPVYSCKAKLGIEASSWTQAAVEIGDKGL